MRLLRCADLAAALALLLASLAFVAVVLACNVCAGNREPAAVARAIEAAGADVVLLTEIDTRILAVLGPALARYRSHREACDDHGDTGIGVWSRHDGTSPHPRVLASPIGANHVHLGIDFLGRSVVCGCIRLLGSRGGAPASMQIVQSGVVLRLSVQQSVQCAGWMPGTGFAGFRFLELNSRREPLGRAFELLQSLPFATRTTRSKLCDSQRLPCWPLDSSPRAR